MSRIRGWCVEEEPQDRWDEIQKISREKQDIEGKIIIERATEQNRKKNQSRPIICHLLNYKDKGNILKYCRKLKGTKIFVNKDLSQLTLEHRR